MEIKKEPSKIPEIGTEEEIIIKDEEKAKPKVEQKITKPVKPENKNINFNDIDNILVFLSEDELLSPIFYDVFLENILNYKKLDDIEFIHSIDEIKKDLNNTLIIGPLGSKDLSLLPSKLNENTFILSLSNDYSLMKKFADNEIIFIPNSPYLHVEKLKEYIFKNENIGVLYRQNDYGLKIFSYFEKQFSLNFIKSSSYGTSAIDLELSVNLLGNLDELDKIIIIDDTLSYKDLIGYLATDKKTYPLENIYLIDNFFEQRKNTENYYEPINRTFIRGIDISSISEPHREYLFKQSVEISLILADKIFNTKSVPLSIVHEDLGELAINNQMIDYPIVFD